MWNSFFDVKRDLNEYQANFKGSHLEQALKEKGFSVSLSISLEDKARLTFLDPTTLSHFQVTMDIELSHQTLYMYFSNPYNKELSQLVFNDFESFLLGKNLHFIVILVKKEASFLTEGRIVENCICYPIGKKAEKLMDMMTVFSLKEGNIAYNAFALSESFFYESHLFLDWNLTQEPILSIIYASYKDARNFTILENNEFARLTSKEEALAFVEQLQTEKEQTEKLAEKVKEALISQTSLCENEIELQEEGKEWTIETPECSFFIQPFILNYEKGYALQSPYYAEAEFFKDPDHLIQNVCQEYQAKKETNKTTEEIAKTIQSLAPESSIDVSLFSHSIVSCFGKTLRFRFYYEFNGNILRYFFSFTPLESDLRSLDVQELTESAIDEVKKYIHSIRLRHLMKDKTH
jgi:hypothetical protein